MLRAAPVMMHPSRLQRTASLLLAVAAVCVGPEAMLAQDFRLKQYPVEVACDAGKTPVFDSTTVTVGLSAAFPGTDSLLTPSARDRALFMAQEIRRFFEAPAGLTYPKPAIWSRRPDPKVKPEVDGFAPLSGHATVVFNADERVTAVRPSPRFDNAALRQALEAAVFRADSAGVLTGLRQASVVRPDTVILEMIALRERSAVPVPLFQTRVEFLPDLAPVRMLKAGTLLFPKAAESRGIEASVLLEYIVDPNGLKHSIRVVNETYREFFDAAVAAVQETKFRPAEAGGCRVSQVVAQRLTFKMR